MNVSRKLKLLMLKFLHGNKLNHWMYRFQRQPYDPNHDNLCVIVTCLIVLFLLHTLSFQCSLPVESAWAPMQTTPSLVPEENISLPLMVNTNIYLVRSFWSRSKANGSFQHGDDVPFLDFVFFFTTTSSLYSSLIVMYGSRNLNRKF